MRLVTLLLAMMLAPSCSRERTDAGLPSPGLATPQTITLQRDSLERVGIAVDAAGAESSTSSVELPGTLEYVADSYAEVGYLAEARITAVHANVGDRVKRGQPLATLLVPEITSAQAKALSAQATLDVARDHAKREALLLEGHLTSKSDEELARLAIVNLNAVVNELAKLLHRVIGEDISLSLSLAPELPETLADAAMIEQVLINLATNARDAIVSRRAGSRDERGSISISTRVEVVGAGRPELPAGPYVCIEVKDDGDGISPAVLPQVFEPFFTTKDVGKGTGLGLATVYGIVKQHRGDITVETAAGEGTTFCVLLPAQSVADSSRTRGSAPIQASLPGTGTILVVEDEAAVQAAVNRVLRRQGFNVLLASSGPEALAVWEAHKNEVDVLLTDLVMPLGMRGHELARKIHAEKP